MTATPPGYTALVALDGGATAEVFRAVFEGRPVALKCLRQSLEAAGPAGQRFLREAKLLGRLDHPHIAPVCDHGIFAGRPYLATRWVEGETLAARLGREPDAFRHGAWALLRPLAEALAHAHGVGVIHRDFKAENVILGADGRPTLIDFGHGFHPDEPRLTAVSEPVGSPATMAPEQWWNLTPTHATDQYALGLLVVRLVAGREAFAITSTDEALEAHLHRPPPRLEALGVAASEALEAFVARLLCKDPAGRYASLDEALEAGDLAFETRLKHRRRVPPRVVALGVAVGWALVGDGGLHSPAALATLAGFGAGLSALGYALGLALLGRPGWRDGLALTPWLAGTLGSATGLWVVSRHLARAAQATRFELSLVGAAEAHAGRFIGVSLTVSLLVALAAARLPRGGLSGGLSGGSPGLARRRTLAALGALALTAALAGAGAAEAAALVLATAVFALVFAPHPGPRPAAMLALGLTLEALSISHLTRVARVWSEAPTRALRVAELVRLDDAGARLMALAIVPAALMALAWRRGMPRGSRGVVALTALGFAADLGLSLSTYVSTEGRRAALTRRFTLSQALQLPLRPGGPPSPVAPTLQVLAEGLYLDGVPIGRRQLLDGPDGRAALLRDLAHAVAENDQRGGSEGTDLLLAVDARLPARTLWRVLGLCTEAGFRRVAWLATRERLAPVRRALPAHYAWPLPRDLIAHPVALGRCWPEPRGAEPLDPWLRAQRDLSGGADSADAQGCRDDTTPARREP